MSRKKLSKVDGKERRKILDEFWTMIALLESKEEVKHFFKDLLSATESLMLARRIQIARLLLSGWSYEHIEKRLGTGPTTIASVHRWLHGGFGGYAEALPKLEKEITRRQKVAEKHEKQHIPFSKEWMRKRYPMHYLLANLFDEDLSPSRKLRKGNSRENGKTS